jgi:hypothetical protein
LCDRNGKPAGRYSPLSVFSASLEHDIERLLEANAAPTPADQRNNSSNAAATAARFDDLPSEAPPSPSGTSRSAG